MSMVQGFVDLCTGQGKQSASIIARNAHGHTVGVCFSFLFIRIFI